MYIYIYVYVHLHLHPLPIDLPRPCFLSKYRGFLHVSIVSLSAIRFKGSFGIWVVVELMFQNGDPGFWSLGVRSNQIFKKELTWGERGTQNYGCPSSFK